MLFDEIVNEMRAHIMNALQRIENIERLVTNLDEKNLTTYEILVRKIFVNGSVFFPVNHIVNFCVNTWGYP